MAFQNKQRHTFSEMFPNTAVVKRRITERHRGHILQNTNYQYTSPHPHKERELMKYCAEHQKPYRMNHYARLNMSVGGRTYLELVVWPRSKNPRRSITAMTRPEKDCLFCGSIFESEDWNARAASTADGIQGGLSADALVKVTHSRACRKSARHIELAVRSSISGSSRPCRVLGQPARHEDHQPGKGNFLFQDDADDLGTLRSSDSSF